MNLTPVDKLRLYQGGWYKFKAPPVCHVGWRDVDWVRYIDACKGWTPPLLEPNNLRNCWRRYKLTRQAYGWSFGTFREWYTRTKGDSYHAPPHPANDPVPDLFYKVTYAS